MQIFGQLYYAITTAILSNSMPYGSFFKFLSPKYGLELKTLLVGFLNKSKEGVGEYC